MTKQRKGEKNALTLVGLELVYACMHALLYIPALCIVLSVLGIIQRRPCPEEDAHFLSRITWWWQNGQIWHGWRRPIKYEDLADLNTNDKSRVIAPRFQRIWNEELEKAG